jgi:hypothetical protein
VSYSLTSFMQEGYATRYNVADGDQADADGENANPADPMEGLEGLDVAGPRLD